MKVFESFLSIGQGTTFSCWNLSKHNWIWFLFQLKQIYGFIKREKFPRYFSKLVIDKKIFILIFLYLYIDLQQHSYYMTLTLNFVHMLLENDFDLWNKVYYTFTYITSPFQIHSTINYHANVLLSGIKCQTNITTIIITIIIIIIWRFQVATKTTLHFCLNFIFELFLCRLSK